MAVFLRPFASRAMAATCTVGALNITTRAFSSKHEQPQTELANTTQMQRRIPSFSMDAQTSKLRSLHTTFETSTHKITGLAKEAADKTKAFITSRSPFISESQRLGFAESSPSQKYAELDALIQAVQTIVEKALQKALQTNPRGLSERGIQIELNSELLHTFKTAHQNTRFAQYYLPSDIRMQIDPRGVKVFSSLA